MVKEEEKIFAGKLFWPGDPELKAIKARSHRLSAEYSRLDETDPRRSEIIKDILAEYGEGSFIQGPVFFHYGKHTKIGKRFFANYNLTIQDDAMVEIGDDVNFGPNCTIVTPMHPTIGKERNQMLNENGEVKRLCWAEGVKIGSDCWLGANVTVCPGVTIGEDCVIGAGSVVTKDIPPHSVAVGVPCRVLHPITEKDSMKYREALLGGCSVIDDYDKYKV